MPGDTVCNMSGLLGAGYFFFMVAQVRHISQVPAAALFASVFFFHLNMYFFQILFLVYISRLRAHLRSLSPRLSYQTNTSHGTFTPVSNQPGGTVIPAYPPQYQPQAVMSPSPQPPQPFNLKQSGNVANLPGAQPQQNPV